jgi:hypothetical protein
MKEIKVVLSTNLFGTLYNYSIDAELWDLFIVSLPLLFVSQE